MSDSPLASQSGLDSWLSVSAGPDIIYKLPDELLRKPLDEVDRLWDPRPGADVDHLDGSLNAHSMAN